MIHKMLGRGFLLIETSGSWGAFRPGQGHQQLQAGAVMGASRGGSCLLIGSKLGDPEVRLSRFKCSMLRVDQVAGIFVLTA